MTPSPAAASSRSAAVPVALGRKSMLLRAAVAAATVALGLLALALPAHASATSSGRPPCVASVDRTDGSTSALPDGAAAPRSPCR